MSGHRPKEYLLGIDHGTSMVKAALYDRTGAVRAVESQPLHVLSPHPGWSEVAMPDSWHTCAQVIQNLLRTATIDPPQITGVGVAGNMIGAWLIDKDGQPLRNGILWNDTRTRPLLDTLIAADPDLNTRLFVRSGCVTETGATLPLLRWLNDHEPDLLKRAHAVLQSKDWLNYQLTGQLALDMTEIGGLPGNIHTLSLSDAAFADFGIESFLSLFPTIKPSAHILGRVTDEAAAQTGIRAGTPVVSGAGDVPANAFGIGAVNPGTAFVILGTNLQCCLVTSAPTPEPHNVGLTFALPGAGWFRALMNVAGTPNLDWALEMLYPQAAGPRFEAAEALAQTSAPGSNGILYLPYLSETGLIAPVVQPGARAQFTGLEPRHTRGDMIRAVYEGVAFAIRDCFAAMGPLPDHILFGGGGSRSKLWGQIIADCLGGVVTVPVGEEFGAKGAALLAGIGVGWYENIWDATEKTSKIKLAFEPSVQNVSIYNERYEQYRKLRVAMGRFWL